MSTTSELNHLAWLISSPKSENQLARASFEPGTFGSRVLSSAVAPHRFAAVTRRREMSKPLWYGLSCVSAVCRRTVALFFRRRRQTGPGRAPRGGDAMFTERKLRRHLHYNIFMTGGETDTAVLDFHVMPAHAARQPGPIIRNTAAP